MTEAELLKKLQFDNYTAASDEAIAEEARNRYAASHAANLASLEAEGTSINTNYDRQRDAASEATSRNLSAQRLNAIRSGMQRSSYNNATLGKIQTEGDKTLNDIEQNRTDAWNSLAARRTAEDQTYEANVLAAIDDIRNREYTRAQNAMTTNNNLWLALYNLMQQSASAGGSGGRGGSSTPTATPETPAATGDPYAFSAANADALLNGFKSKYTNVVDPLTNALKNALNTGIAVSKANAKPATASTLRVGPGETLKNSLRIGAGEALKKSLRVGSGEVIR